MKRSVGLERAGWMALLVAGSLALPACSADRSDAAGGGAVIAGVSLLGFNRIPRTQPLAEKYKLRALIEHSDEAERDLSARIA